MALTRTDDLDGTSPAEQVTITVDGQTWHVDLGELNKKRLMDALSAYTSKGTEVKAKGKKTGAKATARKWPAYKETEVRDFARSAGLEVKDRGRIPGAVLEAYFKAQGQEATAA